MDIDPHQRGVFVESLLAEGLNEFFELALDPGVPGARHFDLAGVISHVDDRRIVLDGDVK